MNWIFGDKINTDLITPGRYNMITDPHELAKIAFVEAKPAFAREVRQGDFSIAGDNFGSGSSRETAAVALKYSGVQAVIAKSFARIFYRNALNVGLLLVTADTSLIKAEDDIEIDQTRSVVINHTRGQEIPADIPHLMQVVHAKGGILQYLRDEGMGDLKGALQRLISQEGSHV